VSNKTKKELLAIAKEMGLVVSAKTSKTKLEEMLAAASAEPEAVEETVEVAVEETVEVAVAETVEVAVAETKAPVSPVDTTNLSLGDLMVIAADNGVKLHKGLVRHEVVKILRKEKLVI
jgi:hypothetical protein